MKTKEELLELIPQLQWLEDSDIIEVWDLEDPYYKELFTYFVDLGGSAVIVGKKVYVPIKNREKPEDPMKDNEKAVHNAKVQEASNHIYGS